MDSKDAVISWSIGGEEAPVTGAGVCFMDEQEAPRRHVPLAQA